MSDLQAGLAQVDFTPGPGLPIMGHFRQDYAARGTHDPLYCKALVLQDQQGNRAALACMDICMLDRRQVAFFRKCAADQTDIPAENVLLSATHTHGGPATRSLYDCPKASDQQVEGILTRAAQAVVEAAANLRPARLRIGRAEESRVSFNRRLRSTDGRTVMNWTDPDPQTVASALGPTDTELISISIECDDCCRGALINFALHPAIVDYENQLYTADYPGYLSQALTQIKGPDSMTLFFNGCCGNVNHIDYSDSNSPRRGFVMAQRVGYMLAAAAAQAISNAVELSAGPVLVSREMVTLNRYPISPSQYQQAQNVLQDNRDTDYQQIDGIDARSSAPLIIRMYEQQDEPDQVEVMVLRIGELAIVALPGEVFTEFGLQIKQQSPAAHTIVIELANDAVGYLPSAEAFKQGGYEVTPGGTAYEAGSAEKLVASAFQQLQQLLSKL